MEQAIELQSRSRVCAGCGKKLQDREVFSFKDQVFCQDCYLGDEGLGPFADQYISCPHCGTTLHRFTVVCHNCNKAIREVGKIQAETKHMALRVLTFMVSVLIFVLLPIVLAPIGMGRGGSMARAVTLSVVGPLMVLLGEFRLLFPLLFFKRRYIGSLWGGLVSWVLVILGIVVVVAIPYP